MAIAQLRNVLNRIGQIMAPRQARDLPDQELLARFLRQRDEGAFAALMERHGAMVLGVCSRVLRNAHDAEDACQAVFLVLARKADSVRKQGSLGSWLHGVAWRISRKLRAHLARQRTRERAVAAQQPSASEPADLTWRELLQVLDEELQRLPATYRAPLVLCHLEGRTQDEAARELGWSLGTFRGRLERGRDKLRARLARRGITASAALAIAALAPSVCAATVPPILVVTTVNASLAMMVGEPLPATISAQASSLVQEFLGQGLLSGFKMTLGLVLIGVLLSFGAVCFDRSSGQEQPVAPQPPRLVETWTPARRLAGHAIQAWCVAFSPDGKLLASGAGGTIANTGEIRLWDVASGQLQLALPTAYGVRCLVFTPDGESLATAEHDGVARLRDVKSGDVLRSFRGHKANIDTVSLSSDGKRIATSSWDRTVKLWDTATGEEVSTLDGQGGQLFAVAIAPDGRTLAAGGVHRLAKVWELGTDEVAFTLKGHKGVIHWLTYSPDSTLIATASWDKTVNLWDASNGKLLATLRGHTEPVLAVAFSPDGRTLASCSGKWGDAKAAPNVPSPGEVILWDVATRTLRSRLRDHQDRLFGLAFSPDSSQLAVAGWDGSVTLWQRVLAAPQPALPEDPKPEVVLVDVEAPKAAQNREFQFSLKEDMESRDGIKLMGPKAKECVRFEAAGLRITLPAGYLGERPNTGVRIATPIEGDFEATVNYEILMEPDPAELVGKKPTKIMLQAQLDREEWTVAALTRRVAPGKGLQFTAWTIRDNDQAQRRTKYREYPAQAKRGQIRLVRASEAITFYVADGPGAELKQLDTLPCGEEDLSTIELTTSTGGPKDSVDVRFSDLHVRSSAAPNNPAVNPEEPPAPRTWSRFMLALEVIVSVAAVGTWLRLRRRRADKTSKDTPPQ
jgi:RNA polymerase sigma factor (sigma-70 family)